MLWPAETPDEGFVFDYTDAKGVEEEEEDDEDEEDEEEEETKTPAPAPAPPSAAQKTKSGKPNHRATAAMNTLDEDGTGFSFE
jgi:hypothetical protein